jgi:hypothetical protein
MPSPGRRSVQLPTNLNEENVKVWTLAILLISFNASAQPWARDCVSWWGGAIPIESRTSENCPNQHSHWDQATNNNPNYSLDSRPRPQHQAQTRTTSLPSTLLTPQGMIMIVPNYSTGSISAVISTSRSK